MIRDIPTDICADIRIGKLMKSDAFALQTRAVQQDGHWELTGSKFSMTNGAEAGIYIVYPRPTRQRRP